MTLTEFIRAARGQHASDLHLIAGLPPAIRVDGEIIMANLAPLSREDLQRITAEVLNDKQKAHLEKEWELCFSMLDGDEGRIRVTIYYHAGSPEVSVRLCVSEIPTAEDLGLPPAIDDLARRPNGLVLIASPTGAGKTTTLSYMVDLINRERRCKIIMIEDPVEYLHRSKKSLIVQQEVHTDTVSFPRALIHALRQNPDVIVI